jgi:hypothetical protein
MLVMDIRIALVIGIGALALILLVWLSFRGRRGARDEGSSRAPETHVREISDEEFWALYWQRRIGIRRETKTVRAKSMSVILFGQIPISPIHSSWVYDLEKSMLANGLITQPAGTNWLPTDEGKRALDARLAKNGKPERTYKPFVNAENLQNIKLESVSD